RAAGIELVRQSRGQGHARPTRRRAGARRDDVPVRRSRPRGQGRAPLLRAGLTVAWGAAHGESALAAGGHEGRSGYARAQMSPTSGARRRPFDSLYEHGFVRLAAAAPRVHIAQPDLNAERTIALARRASEEGAALVVFPELGLSGYSIEDLFHQQAVIDGVLGGVERIVPES